MKTNDEDTNEMDESVYMAHFISLPIQEQLHTAMHPLELKGFIDKKSLNVSQRAITCCLLLNNGRASEDRILLFLKNHWDLITQAAGKNLPVPDSRIMHINLVVKKKGVPLFIQADDNPLNYTFNRNPKLVIPSKRGQQVEYQFPDFFNMSAMQMQNPNLYFQQMQFQNQEPASQNSSQNAQQPQNSGTQNVQMNFQNLMNMNMNIPMSMGMQPMTINSMNMPMPQQMNTSQNRQISGHVMQGGKMMAMQTPVVPSSAASVPIPMISTPDIKADTFESLILTLLQMASPKGVSLEDLIRSTENSNNIPGLYNCLEHPRRVKAILLSYKFNGNVTFENGHWYFANKEKNEDNSQKSQESSQKHKSISSSMTIEAYWKYLKSNHIY